LTRYTFSVALARSSALALVEAKLNAHLESVGKVPGLLESTGTQPLKRKEVIRKIGELMVLREAVNFRGGGLEDTPEVRLIRIDDSPYTIGPLNGRLDFADLLVRASTGM